MVRWGNFNTGFRYKFEFVMQTNQDLACFGGRSRMLQTWNLEDVDYIRNKLMVLWDGLDTKYGYTVMRPTSDVLEKYACDSKGTEQMWNDLYKDMFTEAELKDVRTTGYMYYMEARWKLIANQSKYELKFRYILGMLILHQLTYMDEVDCEYA